MSMKSGSIHRRTTLGGAWQWPHLLAAPDDDVIMVIEDVEERDLNEQPQSAWLILIADDDHSVHEATVAALAGQRLHNRPLSFLHAYSATETLSLLSTSPGVHLVLLDVVMESPDAGLRAVTEIRKNPALSNLKIVIRTGQPGHAPEQEIRREYAIDGYAKKAELTRSLLREVIATVLQPEKSGVGNGFGNNSGKAH